MVKVSTMGYLLVAPILLFFIAFSVYPLAFGLWISMRNAHLTQSLDLSQFTGISNYIEALTNPLFQKSLFITFYFTAGAVVLELLLGLGLALLVTNMERGIGAVQTVLVWPLMISPTVIAGIFRLMMDPSFGVFNYLLGSAGLSTLNWIYDETLAVPSLIFVDVWQWTPFIFLVILAGLRSVPPNLIDSANVDGAGYWQTFRAIVWPTLTPFIAVGLVFRLTDAIKEVDKVMNLTRGGPAFASASLHFYSWWSALQVYDLGYGTAVAFIFLVIINIVMTVQYRIMQRTLR